MEYDAVIIGAGAAGMMAAAVAGQRGRRILLLEHSQKPGMKITISGGGRCNFTNIHTRPENFISENPHFCKSALSRFTPDDFISLVEKHRIPYHEKKLGQLFCDNKSQDIIDMLLKECAEGEVQITFNCSVQAVRKAHDAYIVDTSLGPFHSPKLVIATGGLSIPKSGATGFAYEIASQFGLNLIPTRPALVPFVWNGDDKNIYGKLTGISTPCRAANDEISFEENLLFTHRGLSGPAILQISSYWQENEAVHLDLLPDEAPNVIEEWKQTQAARPVSDMLKHRLPKRLIAMIEREWIHDSRPLGQIPDDQIRSIQAQLKDWTIYPAGSKGYQTAEVTRGGIDTNELSSKTMEARKSPGLYFIGEAVDVTGWLGGYNFQWAWASAWSAAQHI